MAGDRVVDQPQVDRPPRIVVGRAFDAGERRARDDLPPEEAVEIDGAVPAGQHAVGDVEVLPAVAVEIDRIGRPGPAPHRGARVHRAVVEGAVPAVAEQRVAPGVSPVQTAHVGRSVWHERRGRGDALARRAPHVARVDVEQTVVVVVEEGGAHAGGMVEHACPLGLVGEAHDAGAVLSPEVAIQVVGAEVVGDQQVGPAIAVVVGPGRGEVIAVVALAEAGLPRDVDEPAGAVVAKQVSGRTVARIVVRHGCAGLVFPRPEEVRVDAQVHVEEAVAIEVGHRDAGEHALQRLREAEGAIDLREAPCAVVGEDQRLKARGDHEILVAVVVHVGEERVRGVVEQAQARAFGDVLERAVAAGAEQQVGQAGRLRHVQVVEAIAVGVADRHAVMAVRVARQHRVERR